MSSDQNFESLNYSSSNFPLSDTEEKFIVQSYQELIDAIVNDQTNE